MKELSFSSKLVSAKGGTLDYVSPEGEILATVFLPPGLHRARPYLEACPEGAAVQVAGGVVALDGPSPVGIVPYGEGSHDSGANPDWQPRSNAEQLADQMRLGIERLNRNNDRLERKLRAMASVERIPAAPSAQQAGQSEDAPVVE